MHTREEAKFNLLCFVRASLSSTGFYIYTKKKILVNPEKMKGGGQHFEQSNVEQPIFRNFEIPNIKRTKDELFDFFIFIFVQIIRTLRIYDNS